MNQAERNIKHFGKDWANFLAPFLASKEYKTLGANLLKLQKEGVILTPDLRHVFRAFSECPFNKVHSMIIGMDPYPGTNKDGTPIADGLAFSARESEDAPKSLNLIYEALDTTVFSGHYTPRGSWNYKKEFIGHGLMHWAHDGVLMLNCSLTTIVGRSGDRDQMVMWLPFIEYVIHETCKRKDGMGVIMMGAHARQFSPLVSKNPTNQAFECEHPSAAARQNRSWNHNDSFAGLTHFHSKMNNLTIDW